MKTTALKKEEKRQQLAEEYKTLTARRSENNEAMNKEKITAEEFIKTADDIQREFRNWRARARRYVVNMYETLISESKPYRDEVMRHLNIKLAKSDETDLYYEYIKR